MFIILHGHTVKLIPLCLSLNKPRLYSLTRHSPVLTELVALTGPLPCYLPEIAVKGSKELFFSGKVATYLTGELTE